MVRDQTEAESSNPYHTEAVGDPGTAPSRTDSVDVALAGEGSDCCSDFAEMVVGVAGAGPLV